MNIQVSLINQLGAVTFASHETNHTRYKLVGCHRAYELPAEGTYMDDGFKLQLMCGIFYITFNYQKACFI